MRRPIRPLVVGWFGERNLGDEAMLEGLLALLGRTLGPIEPTVVTADPEATAAAFGVRTLRRSRPAASGFRNLDLVRASARASLVTLGGGDLIRDSPNGAHAALWLQRVRVPLALRRPVALIGVSVGELDRSETLAEVRRSLGRLRFVAARDRVSVVRLAELGAPRPLLMGDLALEAPAAAVPSVPAASPGAAPRIGIALRELVDRGASIPADAGERLQQQLARALDRVVHQTGARIELVPFRTRALPTQKDDDARAGERLAADAATGADWIRHPRPTSIAEFSAIAAGLDLVVGMRLHATILGAAAGRRVVALDYDPKVGAFLRDMGLGDQVLPLDADGDDIAAAIERSLSDPGLPARIAAGVEAARARTRSVEPALGALVPHPQAAGHPTG